MFQTLAHDPRPAQWPCAFYAFNPRITAKYKETFSDKDKTDDSDAYIVADRLRTFSAPGPAVALRSRPAISGCAC